MSISTDEGTHPSVKQVFQRILQGTGVYSSLNIVQRMVSLLLLPISTKYLMPADYAVLNLLEQTFVVVALLLGMQLAGAIGYFYFEKDSKTTPQQAVSTALVGSLLLGILAAGAGAAVAGPLSHLVFDRSGFEMYLRIALMTLPLYIFSEAAFTWLRIEERLKMYAVASLVRLPLIFLAVLSLVAWRRLGVLGMLLANLSVSAAIDIILIVYVLRFLPLRFDGGLFRRMLRFAAPMSISGLAMFFIHYGDSFVLPHYRPLTEVGLYGTAYKIGMLESFISGSFLTYWNAQVYKILQRDDARAIFARITTHMTLALAFSALGLVLFAHPALVILTQPPFYGAAAIVPLLVLAYFFRSIAEFLRSLFLATNHPGKDAICISVSLAVCTAGYFFFIPTWGMWGAATATAASFAFMMILTGVWAHRLWAFDLETMRLVKIALATAVPVVAHFLMPRGSLWMEIARATLLLASFPALLLGMRFVTPAEWKLIGSGWQRVRAWRG